VPDTLVVMAKAVSVQHPYNNPMASPKSARLDIRIAPEDRERFDRAAAATGKSLSDFIVEGGREHADRVLADRTVFSLDAASWETFVTELDRPPRENAKLDRLLSSRRPA
jgi:uncharacterized protein (DUF1778 family)